MPVSITTARRAREFAAREELIASRRRRGSSCCNRGFQGWNMDDLAHAVEYSKGTSTEHFESKEDIALAVCTGRFSSGRTFERASGRRATSRERSVRLLRVL